eukprot:m.575555 g.575555  ORF g.575555 m.575555 type:complete len:62 (-) comp22284_c1_seq54:2901-3086(-)
MLGPGASPPKAKAARPLGGGDLSAALAANKGALKKTVTPTKPDSGEAALSPPLCVWCVGVE